METTGHDQADWPASLLADLRLSTRAARRGERVPRERLIGWLEVVERLRAAGEPATSGLVGAARALLRASVRTELDLAANRLGLTGPIDRSVLAPAQVAELRSDLDALTTLGGRTTGMRERLAGLCRRRLEGRLIALEQVAGGIGTAASGALARAEASAGLDVPLSSVAGLLPGRPHGRLARLSAPSAPTVWDDLVAAEAAGVSGLDPLRERAAALALAASIPSGGLGRVPDLRAGNGVVVTSTELADRLAGAPVGTRARLFTPAWSAEAPGVLATEQFASDVDARSRALVSNRLWSGLPAGNYSAIDLLLLRPTRVRLDWIAGEPDPWEDAAAYAAAQAAVASLTASGTPVELERGWALPAESRDATFARPASETILNGPRGPVSLGSQPAFERAITLAQRPGFVQLLVRRSEILRPPAGRGNAAAREAADVWPAAGAGATPDPDTRGGFGTGPTRRFGFATVGSASQSPIAPPSIGDEIIARSISSAAGEGLAGVQFSLAAFGGNAGSRSDLDVPESALVFARPAGGPSSGGSLDEPAGAEMPSWDGSSATTRRHVVRVELDWVPGSNPWKHPEALIQTLQSVRRLGEAHGVEFVLVRGREVHPTTWNPTFARASRDLSVAGPRGPISFAEIAAFDGAVPLGLRPGAARFLVAPPSFAGPAPSVASAAAIGRPGVRSFGTRGDSSVLGTGGPSDPSGMHPRGILSTARRGGRDTGSGGATSLAFGSLPWFGFAGPGSGPRSAGGPTIATSLVDRGLAVQDPGQRTPSVSSLSGDASVAWLLGPPSAGLGLPLPLTSAPLATSRSGEPAPIEFSTLPLGLALAGLRSPFGGTSAGGPDSARGPLLFSAAGQMSPIGRGHALGVGSAAPLGSALAWAMPAFGGGPVAGVDPTRSPGASAAGLALAPGGDPSVGRLALPLTRAPESVRVELDLPGGGDARQWDQALAEARLAAESLAPRGVQVEIVRGRELPTAAYVSGSGLPSSSFVLMGTRGAVDLSSLRVLDQAVPVVQRPGLLRVIVAPGARQALGGSLGLSLGLASAASSFAGSLPGAAAFSFSGGSAGRIGTTDSFGYGSLDVPSTGSPLPIGASRVALNAPAVVGTAGRILPRWNLPVAAASPAGLGGPALHRDATPGGFPSIVTPSFPMSGPAGAARFGPAFGEGASAQTAFGRPVDDPGSTRSPLAWGVSMGSAPAGSATGHVPGDWNPRGGPVAGEGLGSLGAGRFASDAPDWSPPFGGSSTSWGISGRSLSRGGASPVGGPPLAVPVLPPLAAGISFPRSDQSTGSPGNGATSSAGTAEVAAWIVGLAQTAAGSSGAPGTDLRLPTAPRRESLALATTKRSLSVPATDSRGTTSESVESAQIGSTGVLPQAGVDQMAREVYAIIRHRLAVERERGSMRGERAW